MSALVKVDCRNCPAVSRRQVTEVRLDVMIEYGTHFGVATWVCHECRTENSRTLTPQGVRTLILAGCTPRYARRLAPITESDVERFAALLETTDDVVGLMQSADRHRA